MEILVLLISTLYLARCETEHGDNDNHKICDDGVVSFIHAVEN